MTAVGSASRLAADAVTTLPLPVVAPGLAVLHADADMLVLDKPAGLLAVPGRGPDKQDSLATRAAARHPGALVVHRLDMATSGVIVMALHARAQRTLSLAFAERRVAKRYVARVAGVPEAAVGEIDWPIAPDWPRRPLRRIDAAHGKPALTRWRRLAGWPERDCALLELVPVTGRTHQLRLHLAALGHPILGDALYAPPEVAALAPRLLLHAADLTVPHPASGEPVHFASPVPFGSFGPPTGTPRP